VKAPPGHTLNSFPNFLPLSGGIVRSKDVREACQPETQSAWQLWLLVQYSSTVQYLRKRPGVSSVDACLTRIPLLCKEAHVFV